ncbi:MAG: hypothetical protein ABI760_04770 [Ferruginibacter sp.]
MKQVDVFIVRPFGIKKVLRKTEENRRAQVDFDFEKVNTTMIDPALTLLNLRGGTTAKIFEAGDIR